MKIIYQHKKLVRPLPDKARIVFESQSPAKERIVIEVENYDDLPILSRIILANNLKAVDQFAMNATEKKLINAIKHGYLPLTLAYYYSPADDNIVYLKFDEEGNIEYVKTYIAKASLGGLFSNTAELLLKKLKKVM